MRKLFILRGIMGSGKSTFITENNLEDYTLSTDKIRLLYNSPEMTLNYTETIPQYNNKKVWELLLQILIYRMSKGELTFIDAMHIYKNDLTTYKKLAEKYRYRMYIIDFSDIPLEELLKRNSLRETKKQVSVDIIKKLYKDIQKETIPKSFTVLKPQEFTKTINKPPINYDTYQKIHIFGDIHGSYKPLEEYITKNRIQDNELYIFLGDYFDRGLENIKVFNFIKEHISRDNFIFLIGNHEDRLYKYACDDKYKLDYDLMMTLKEFNNTIEKSEIRGLIKGLAQLVNFVYKGKKYVVTHGGIPYYPKKPLDFYSTNSFIYGVDKYDVNIDEIYNQYMVNSEDKVYQIHGHRNYYSITYDKYDYSFNLDGDTSNGGSLRILTLNSDGTRDIELIKNDFYDENLKEKEKVYSLMEDFKNNKYVTVKEFDNISSFNFSKETFYHQMWNDMTIKARGLFIDTYNYLIVARSYNKFFNLGERVDTKYNTLREKLEYPLYGYIKYNGFLGMLSVYHNELLFCTKSLLNGLYSEYFKSIFYKCYTKEQIAKIKEYLLINKSTMVFEVIDTINDKHIIEYEKDNLILLDEIYNTCEFKKTNYSNLNTFAASIQIPVKELAFTIQNKEEFDTLLASISEDNYTYKNNHIEGFVFEDSNNFMFKFKTNYYKHWKMARSIMEKALKKKDFSIRVSDEFKGFLLYLESKYKDKKVDLDTINIIDERKEYERSD